MSKTKRQKSRRLQNRLMAEDRYYKNIHTDHTLKGVGERDVIRILANGIDSVFSPLSNGHFNNARRIKGGVYNAFQMSYVARHGKQKTHIATAGRYEHHVKMARKLYRKLFEVFINSMGGNQSEFEIGFRKHYPREWRLIEDNKFEQVQKPTA